MLYAVKPEEEIEPTFSVGEVLIDEMDATRYEVHELIGRGGMGDVYRAMRISDGAPCAVKCVRRDLIHNSTILLRTRFEAQAFREIEHPNVVRVHGTGVRSDNVPWMAMEWLRGFTVADIIEKRGRIPLRWAVEIVRDLCRGLGPIHKYAIHRDIKPQNIHFGLDAVTRVLDLGAAKSKEANVHLTTTGFQVGTLPFMAPEQLDNTMDIDHRADLWAAIVVLYILMTGVHPFARGGKLPANRIKLGFSILTDPHRPLLSVLPSVPAFFGQLIDRGLAKEPENRHRSAEELAQVLTAALEYLETSTGHAEPLSSLVDQLAAETEPVVIAAPRLLWTPPRTTDPMPPPAPRSPAPEAQPLVRIVWSAPGTTEPMPAPAPRTASAQDAPARAAPEPQRAAITTEEVLAPEPTDRHQRLTIVPAPSWPPGSTESTESAKHAPADEEAVPPANAVEPPTAPEDPRPEEQRRSGSVRRWLTAASLFGAPRWLVVVMCASAVISTTETLYFFGPRRTVERASGPIVVPFVPMPEPEPEDEPAPAPPTPPSATNAPSAKGTAEPHASARPLPAPRAPGPVPGAARATSTPGKASPPGKSSSPTPSASATSRRLFDVEK